MKKIILSLAVLASVALVSCSGNTEAKDSNVADTTATEAPAADTNAAAADTNKEVVEAPAETPAPAADTNKAA